jgi:hypothetical protein
MSEQEPDVEPQSSIQVEIKKLLAEQIARPCKVDDMLAVCHDLLMLCWHRLQPTLGRTTVVAMVERALQRAAAKYPQIACVQVRPAGVSLAALRQHLEEADRDAVRMALAEFMEQLIGIVVVLTGDILVRQLLGDLESRQAG